MSEPAVMKRSPAVRRTASRLLRLHHFYRAPAKVVVIRRNPLSAPDVDAFLPFGSWRDSQETFLVVVLNLGPLPSHAELAADFSKALLHCVVQLEFFIAIWFDVFVIKFEFPFRMRAARPQNSSELGLSKSHTSTDVDCTSLPSTVDPNI